MPGRFLQPQLASAFIGGRLVHAAIPIHRGTAAGHVSARRHNKHVYIFMPALSVPGECNQ